MQNSRIKPVDILIGKNVAAFRMDAGLSQSDLAEELDLSLSQIQKYEGGRDRISASTLWEISGLLGADIADFYIEDANRNCGLHAIAGLA